MNNDRAWGVARIAGIEIRIHLSWIPALALITVFVGLAPYGPLVAGDEIVRFAVGGAIAVLVLVSIGSTSSSTASWRGGAAWRSDRSRWAPWAA